MTDVKSFFTTWRDLCTKTHCMLLPVSVAAVWNDLSVHVTSVLSLAMFRHRLMTFLFSRCYPDIVI